MNIKTQLLSGRNKFNIWDIANYIGDDPKRFAVLWDLIYSGEAPLPQYGAWALEKCGEKYPEMLLPYVGQMIEVMQRPVHVGVVRGITKVLSLIELPEEVTGELYDLCVDWILQEKTAIAVKAHCMSIAANIAQPFPELCEELAIVFRDQMEHHDSAGVKSRGKRLLKQLGF